MFRTLGLVLLSLSLVSCGPVTVTTSSGSAPSATERAPAPAVAPETVSRRKTPQSASDFRVVVRRVEPVAERTCRQIQPNLNCDFNIVIDDRPGLPPNAFQTYDREGRPVIGFTEALFEAMQNRDELAFALSHEAAHHIRGHIQQTQGTAAAGAIVGGLLASIAGLDPAFIETAQNIGGTIGARTYSKRFELEADSLGAQIAQRAGYDPIVGVQYFQRAPDPGDQFLGTHPPNADRINVVRRSISGG